MGGSINGGTPTIDGLFHGKSIYKWMRIGGRPMTWETSIYNKIRVFTYAIIDYQVA